MVSMMNDNKRIICCFKLNRRGTRAAIPARSPRNYSCIRKMMVRRRREGLLPTQKKFCCRKYQQHRTRKAKPQWNKAAGTLRPVVATSMLVKRAAPSALLAELQTVQLQTLTLMPSCAQQEGPPDAGQLATSFLHHHRRRKRKGESVARRWRQHAVVRHLYEMQICLGLERSKLVMLSLDSKKICIA